MEKYMFADGLMSEAELSHYGVPMKSGRYPWGSGENPYHHGTSAPGGGFKARRQARKAAKAAKRESARKASEEKTKAEHEAAKEKALKSGSAREIEPYIRELSDSQLRELKNRLELEAGFRRLVIEENKTDVSKLDATMKKIEKTTSYVNTGINAYNAFAKVYNAFSTKADLPVIGSKGRKDISKSIEDKRSNRSQTSEILAKRRAETAKAEAEAYKAQLEAQIAEDELKKRRS